MDVTSAARQQTGVTINKNKYNHMKIRIKKLVCIGVLMVSGLAINAQEIKASELLKKVETHYKNTKTFNLDVEYAMYKGYTGTHRTESYMGSMYKNNEVTQIKVLGSEIVQFPKAQLTINNDYKTVTYNEITDKTLQQSPLDISAFLNFYKVVSTEVSGSTIIQELVVKNSQLPIPYNKIILHINKQDYSIKKQVLYLATKVPFIDDEGKSSQDVGRMVITFKTKPMPEDIPELQDYVILGANDKLRLAKAYTTYNIIDQSNI